MDSGDLLVLGYDPGGAGKNGVAALTMGAGRATSLAVATLDSVDEVVSWFEGAAQGSPPNGIGIDASLSWSTGPSGWRPMDTLLRRRYPKARNSVLSTSSAMGSMAVQGPACAMRLRGIWPTLLVNETHPKVLQVALRGSKPDFERDRAILVAWLESDLKFSLPPVANEHEWDACLSAWATVQGLAGKWKVDLMKLEGTKDLLLPAGPVEYWWPDPE